jgi:Asp-tRNA(Asn)/Glu-tRNA(Gln) amidotransferase A subunit family amidase
MPVRRRAVVPPVATTARDARLVCSLVGAALLLGAGSVPASAQARPFRVEEVTIADVHAALRAGRTTCRAVVDAHLRRIAAYDRQGPALNTVVSLDPDARRTADSLDAVQRRGGPLGPLHCVPLVVKENFETRTLPTTAGSLALKAFVAGRDAFQVARVRAAGAVLVAKVNMAELAFSPYETVSSILPGYTKNPYALDRVTAGSSGGTAAAVAASFALAGLGTDTGNSIRGPSSHQALVGIRSTIGLTSRGGVVPLNLGYDIAGPMARTVADAAAILQVVAGYDPADPVTLAAKDRAPVDYLAALRPGGLRGARLAVLRQAWERPTVDAEVRTAFDRAVADLRAQGAVVLDSLPLPSLDSLMRADTAVCSRFRADFERWLASTDGRAPVASLDSLVASRRYHPSIAMRLMDAQRATLPPESAPGCAADEVVRERLRAMMTEAMDAERLDAVIYPTWSNPPRLIGDLNTPHGDNSQYFSPMTGWPAVQVPMGWTRGGTLPAGLTILGRAWDEARLLTLAYGYEQATRHRRAPASVPPLRSR